MPVLPTFKAFLQKSTSLQPPSSLYPHRYSYLSHDWQLASNASGMQVPCYSSNDHYENSYVPVSSSPSFNRDTVSYPCTSFKRPLTTVGLNVAPRSPSTAYNSGGKRVKKKYLKEQERWEIVRRVRAGERQAHLAKEFGVTRAAVCYLLKNQTAIMRRLSQSPFILPDGIYAS